MQGITFGIISSATPAFLKSKFIWQIGEHAAANFNQGKTLINSLAKKNVLTIQPHLLQTSL